MKSKLKELLTFLLLAFIIPWIMVSLIIYYKVTAGLAYYLLVGFGAMSPSISALITTSLYKGCGKTLGLLKTAVNINFSYFIYFLFFLVVIVSYYSGTLIAIAFGSAAPAVWIMIPRKISTLLVSPIGEEIGWRGLLNSYLLQTFSPLIASLLTGMVWGIWHLWYYAVPGTFHFSLSFWIFLIDVCGSSLWYTYFYIKSKGSVFTAIAFHFASNLVYNIVPNSPVSMNGDMLPYLITSLIVLTSGMFVILFSKPTTSIKSYILN